MVSKSLVYKKVFESVISPNDMPNITSIRILNMDTMI